MAFHLHGVFEVKPKRHLGMLLFLKKSTYLGLQIVQGSRQ